MVGNEHIWNPFLLVMAIVMVQFLALDYRRDSRVSSIHAFCLLIDLDYMFFLFDFVVLLIECLECCALRNAMLKDKVHHHVIYCTGATAPENFSILML